MQTLRIALVGCGRVSSVHLAAISRLPALELIAVCDTDDLRRTEVLDQYAVVGYSSYEKMIATEEIDCVHICTPHYLHSSMAITAMEAGMNVLVEKPMAIRVSDGKKMIAVANQTGKNLGVVFQNRYNWASQKAKALIGEGVLGKIQGAVVIACWERSSDYYRADAWRGTLKHEGGGVLINQAIHSVDLLQWLLGGHASSVEGQIATRCHPDIEVEDVAEACVWFGDLKALIYATTNYSYNAPIEIEIHGSKCSLRIIKNRLLLRTGTSYEEIFPNRQDRALEEGEDYWGTSHHALIEDYYKRITVGMRPEIDGNEGLGALRIVRGIYRSSEENRKVLLDE